MAEKNEAPPDGAPTPSIPPMTLARATLEQMSSCLSGDVQREVRAVVMGVQMSDGSWQIIHSGDRLARHGLIQELDANLRLSK